MSYFTSAKVGSEVTYHCDEGLNLVGERVDVCTLRLVWDPMGSEVMCAPPSLGESRANNDFTLFVVIFTIYISIIFFLFLDILEITLMPTPTITQIPIPKQLVSQCRKIYL